MVSLMLPIAGVFLSIFLLIVYFSKKNYNNKETKIYSRMLIVNFFYSLLCIIGYVYAKKVGNLLVVGYMQKIYMILMLLLIVYIIIYNINLIFKDDSRVRILESLIYISFFVFSILVLFTSINVINYDDILDGNGISYNIVIGATIFYFILIIISCVYLFLKNRSSFSKGVPFVVLIVLYFIGLIIRSVIPSLMFENFFFSFMLLIMYHTIENPDIKMLTELNLAKNELEKANKVKNEFIRSMSHEIRTPLNAIVGFSELATFANTLEEAKENSQDIIDASNKLLEMMNNMFEVFSIYGETNEVENKKYSSKDELEKICKLYKDKIEEKGIKFNVKINEELPFLMGDIKILNKIILNVLDNSYKYTSSGEITLEASYDKEILKIKIIDTGIGIKEEDLKRIFVPFTKSSDTKDSSYSGMGVGLSIVKSLLDKIGGNIKVESKYQSGTQVLIEIKQKEVKR